MTTLKSVPASAARVWASSSTLSTDTCRATLGDVQAKLTAHDAKLAAVAAKLDATVARLDAIEAAAKAPASRAQSEANRCVRSRVETTKVARAAISAARH